MVDTYLQRLAAGEPEALAALLVEPVDWDIPGNRAAAPWLGRRTTRDGVADYLRLLRASVQPIGVKIQHLLVDGEVAVVVGEFASRMLATGTIVESPFSMLFVVRDGLIVRFRLLEDSFAVAEACDVAPASGSRAARTHRDNSTHRPSGPDGRLYVTMSWWRLPDATSDLLTESTMRPRWSRPAQVLLDAGEASKIR